MNKRGAQILIALLGVGMAGAGLVYFQTPRDTGPIAAADGISAETLAFLDRKRKKKQDHPKRFDKPKEAWEFYARQRAPAGSEVVPVERYAQARASMFTLARYDVSAPALLPSLATGGVDRKIMAGSQAWAELGPGNIGGRTRTLVIHPRIPRVMYMAGVAGGVWKTINAGKKWVPLDDMMANLAVTTLAMNPKNPRTLYAGTGEGFFNADAVRGDGIFKTSNNGLTWKQLPGTANNPDFRYVNKIVVSAEQPKRVYAATRTGVWRSLNGGNNWRKVLAASVTGGGCLDIVIRTDRIKDHLLVSCGSFEPATVYRSVNNGNTFAPVLSDPNMGRTSLAIAPSKQKVVYALAASIDQRSDYKDGLHAVYRSANGGKTWVKKVDNTSADKLSTLLLTNTVFANLVACRFDSQDSYFNQGWYDNVIAVDPKKPNVVWAGGIDLFRSINAGKNWGVASYWWADPNATSYVHADQHGIVFHPGYNGQKNRVMYVTNDGGIFRTNNARAPVVKGPTAACDPDNGRIVWKDLNNNYAVTQFYHGQSYPNGATYFGGTQDNGTVRGSNGGANRWQMIQGGDGGYVAVDPRNTNVLFAEFTGLSIQRSDDGGQSFVDATSGINESSGNFEFINAFSMDPNNPARLWTGGTTVWRTDNQGSRWSQASTRSMANGSFSAWAVAAGDSNRVAGGTSVGLVYSTDRAVSADANTLWDSQLPQPGYVSSLLFDPQDSDTLYATYSTFGVPHLWRGSRSPTGWLWSPIDRFNQPDGIPDLPVHTVAVDPDHRTRLFVGTDLGIFVSLDGGGSWTVANTGFTNTVVEHLQILRVGGNKFLYAFTHGRGTWRTRLAP